MAVLFFFWWILNIVQSSFTGLADDEAYYWYYASNLDWGYFDHPPVTALLVWMGGFIGGSLGIRFFITLLQPLALYLFWTLIRPENPSRRDVWLYAAICFSLPVAQLYGFIASPDGPLMFSVAVFFWAYSRFCRRDSLLNTALLGFSMALMAYSKYHGALVVILTLLSHPKLLRNPKFYLSCLFTLLLFSPHLWWQYQHDWASFRFHLVSRNGHFEWSNLTDFLVNILLVFNPFFLWIYVKGWGKGVYTDNALRRALYFNIAGFLIFFTFSSLRGYVQPQWVLPITWGLIMIIFGWTRQREKVRRFVMKTGMVMAFLILLVRIEAVFNPLGVKFEIFDNEVSFGAVHDAASGRPIIWCGGYGQAAKYRYYTQGECYSQTWVNYRSSQWQFDSYDRTFTGQDVVVELPYEMLDSTSGHVKEKNGNDFVYKVQKNFHPIREVRIDVSGSPLPESVRRGEVMETDITLSNPYSYDIFIDGDELILEFVFGRNYEMFNEYDVCPDDLTVPAGGTASAHIAFRIPEKFQVEPTYGDIEGPVEYRCGFAIKYGYTPLLIQSKECKMTICH